MATRLEVREAFYDELETAASGLVSADNITQEYPEQTEDFPCIVHSDDYRTVEMNNRTGITDVDRDGNGVIQTVYYSTVREAEFSVLILAEDEMVKENIFEAVQTHFEEYTLPVSDTTAIDPDVYRVEVIDSFSQDAQEREPIVRGDSMTIVLSFERIYDLNVDALDTVEQTIDVGTTDTGDGTPDDINTIT